MTATDEIVDELQKCISRNNESAIRNCGEQIHNAGGMQAMQAVHASYSRKYGYANGGNPRLLDQWWDGIGDWRG